MVASGNPSASIALTVGANAITVQVTAENGGTQNYIVTITRRSGNADLSGLLASTATSQTATYSGQTLTPACAAGTTAYGATVGNARTHARVTPTVADPNATVRVGKRGGTPATVTSGTASAPNRPERGRQRDRSAGHGAGHVDHPGLHRHHHSATAQRRGRHPSRPLRSDDHALPRTA